MNIEQIIKEIMDQFIEDAVHQNIYENVCVIWNNSGQKESDIDDFILEDCELVMLDGTTIEL